VAHPSFIKAGKKLSKKLKKYENIWKTRKVEKALNKQYEERV
jgi:hypothetical protein